MPDDKLQRIHLGLATKDEFLQKYSIPSCLIIYNHIRTIEVALKEQSPSLALLAKEYTKNYVLAYIEMWILSLNEFVNIKYGMSPKQMKETAFYIYQDYFYFKISDLTLIFTNAKKGYFGEFLHSLDGSMILSWFKKYSEERADISESLGIQKSEEQKEPEQKRSSYDEEFKKIKDEGFKTFKHEYDLGKLKSKYGVAKRTRSKTSKSKGKK